MEIWKATENDLPGMVDLWWEMQSSQDDYDLQFYKTKSENECRDLARTYFSMMISDKDHLILSVEMVRRIRDEFADALKGKSHVVTQSK
jgi:hypothetical protein